MKFSDGSNVTAAAFARSIVRACHPDQGSPAVAFANNIVGCTAYNQKQGALTGVRAAGQRLTLRLVKPDPTLLAQIAMPFFAAVKPNMPISPRGENVYPSAGPYRIVSREPGRNLVLERNRQYKGNRPANPDRIVVTVNTDQEQSLLQTRAGQADYDLERRTRRRERSAGGRVRRQQEPLLRRSAPRHGLYRAQHRPPDVLQLQGPPGRQLRGRPAGAAAHARQVRRGSHRPDPAAPAPGLRPGKDLPAHGCPAREGERALEPGWRRRLPAHDVGHVRRTRADREVQPRAGGLQGQPEAAAVRCGHQHDGHEGERDRRVLHRLDRRLLRSVRLHQRAPGRLATSRRRTTTTTRTGTTPSTTG